jgi:DNA-binding MarR family transcriptional regulator
MKPQMHNVIKLLGKVAERYYPSRVLTFETAHIFKTLQVIHNNVKASRSLLAEELGLGEGSIKTLVKHLKMKNLVETSKAGMWLTGKGETLFSNITSAIPSETNIMECSITVGRFNHAILVKGLAKEIGSGIEQRDAAIKIGALGATTLVFRDNKLFTSDKSYDIPVKDQKLTSLIIEKLKPQNNDVIIIASADNKKISDLAAKRAALETISNHEKHT